MYRCIVGLYRRVCVPPLGILLTNVGPTSLVDATTDLSDLFDITFPLISGLFAAVTVESDRQRTRKQRTMRARVCIERLTLTKVQK